MKTGLIKGAAMVTRGAPLHFGHLKTIAIMHQDCGVENSLLIIGSDNETPTVRTPISGAMREELILRVLPEMKGRIIRIPDCMDDTAWIRMLDSKLEHFGFDSAKTVFYGGSREDIDFFVNTGRPHRIVNRFDGASPMISASQIRDAIVEGRSVEGLVPTVIAEDVVRIFKTALAEIIEEKSKS